MVYYFVPRRGAAEEESGGDAGKDRSVYMGVDKHENEELIRWGMPEDVWFHVDKLSSAHVYLRLAKGETIEDIPAETLEDCAQLVKANSIQGNKINNVDVVYTPWANLKKTASMEVGQVGFHSQKQVKTIRVEKRSNEIINRLNKTKTERHPDFAAEREAYNQTEKSRRKAEERSKKRVEQEALLAKREQEELHSYKNLMTGSNMKTNKELMEENQGKSVTEIEEDFM
eukprot:jgi/Chlat1/6805/Chrsp51S06497